MNRKQLYGYIIHNGELTFAEDEAETIRQIFAQYQSGLSLQAIAELLNRNGIPYDSERPQWNKHHIKRILENPRYYGTNGYPPIISEQLFRQTQALIQSKTANRGKHTKSGASTVFQIMYCKTCGHPLRHTGGRRQPIPLVYLQCTHCGCTLKLPQGAIPEESTRQYKEQPSVQKQLPATAPQISERQISDSGSVEVALQEIYEGISARFTYYQQELQQPESTGWPDILKYIERIDISPALEITVHFISYNTANRGT